jgi:hypothetical protein
MDSKVEIKFIHNDLVLRFIVGHHGLINLFVKNTYILPVKKEWSGFMKKIFQTKPQTLLQLHKMGIFQLPSFYNLKLIVSFGN